MIQRLEGQLRDLEGHLPRYALHQPAVSGSSVGWHIEHSLLVLDAVSESLTRSLPDQYLQRFDIRRLYVMVTGKIPRGKAQAPKMVVPTSAIDAASLQQHIQQTREKLQVLRGLSPDHYFTHPFLGDFRLKPALRFLYIHTRHHLLIIRDITGATHN